MESSSDSSLAMDGNRRAQSEVKREEINSGIHEDRSVEYVKIYLIIGRHLEQLENQVQVPLNCSFLQQQKE